MDSFWQRALTNARSGAILHPPVGELGSAGWRDGDEIPATLILTDGCLMLLEKPEKVHISSFPSIEFQHVLELDLSGNALASIPDNIAVALPKLKCFFLGGFPEDHPEYKNQFTKLPNLSKLSELEHLSAHDTYLKEVPGLPDSLQILRLDRCPIEGMPSKLPPNLTVLHLEGCPLPGDFDHPHLLPEPIKELRNLQDLQLPDGSHVGEFFGTPLPELLRQMDGDSRRI